jgi:hypothetical protein
MPRMNIKPASTRRVVGTQTSNRYEARFVNGIHTVFDRHHFGHGAAIGTRKEAVRIAGDLNSGKLQWTA